MLIIETAWRVVKTNNSLQVQCHQYEAGNKKCGHGTPTAAIGDEAVHTNNQAAPLHSTETGV
jgi:hypothetical protein